MLRRVLKLRSAMLFGQWRPILWYFCTSHILDQCSGVPITEHIGKTRFWDCELSVVSEDGCWAAYILVAEWGWQSSSVHDRQSRLFTEQQKFIGLLSVSEAVSVKAISNMKLNATLYGRHCSLRLVPWPSASYCYTCYIVFYFRRCNDMWILGSTEVRFW